MDERTRPVIVGMAGPSCAGKTTIAQELRKRLPRTHIISLDDFWKDSSAFPSIHLEDGAEFKNWELPQNLDFQRLHRALTSISRATERRHSTAAMPSIILVEGFLLFYTRKVRDLLDLKIYLNIDDETIFRRRMERKRHVFEGMDRYYREVAIKEYRKHGLPTMRYSDMILDASAPISETVDTIASAIRNHIAARHIEEHGILAVAHATAQTILGAARSSLSMTARQIPRFGAPAISNKAPSLMRSAANRLWAASALLVPKDITQYLERNFA